uniref:Uncharacterized protein n=1 Tax=Chromera velia CCMP2878 TaxID=1169474 RepID=A0A0G4GKI5_9ALVE|eukprot:Cvel_22313.t1-p1 / transcript=Cvel_22313.t1 / gene=Cvel_22313 / organism=Chromera_velia_CCMP2878 / gene_product=hypothetical protein / transcript_product=hypothetical protein / location=Cvel_scaffold2181:1702-8228(+) / protein_length=1030 / sequence_SO=supercontig / SO=protein_coding / is_pseudo=false
MLGEIEAAPTIVVTRTRDPKYFRISLTIQVFGPPVKEVSVTALPAGIRVPLSQEFKEDITEIHSIGLVEAPANGELELEVTIERDDRVFRSVHPVHIPISTGGTTGIRNSPKVAAPGSSISQITGEAPMVSAETMSRRQTNSHWYVAEASEESDDDDLRGRRRAEFLTARSPRRASRQPVPPVSSTCSTTFAFPIATRRCDPKASLPRPLVPKFNMGPPNRDYWKTADFERFQVRMVFPVEETTVQLLKGLLAKERRGDLGTVIEGWRQLITDALDRRGEVPSLQERRWTIGTDGCLLEKSADLRFVMEPGQGLEVILMLGLHLRRLPSEPRPSVEDLYFSVERAFMETVLAEWRKARPAFLGLVSRCKRVEMRPASIPVKLSLEVCLDTTRASKEAGWSPPEQVEAQQEYVAPLWHKVKSFAGVLLGSPKSEHAHLHVGSLCLCKVRESSFLQTRFVKTDGSVPLVRGRSALLSLPIYILPTLETQSSLQAMNEEVLRVAACLEDGFRRRLMGNEQACKVSSSGSSDSASGWISKTPQESQSSELREGREGTTLSWQRMRRDGWVRAVHVRLPQKRSSGQPAVRVFLNAIFDFKWIRNLEVIRSWRPEEDRFALLKHTVLEPFLKYLVQCASDRGVKARTKGGGSQGLYRVVSIGMEEGGGPSSVPIELRFMSRLVEAEREKEEKQRGSCNEIQWGECPKRRKAREIGRNPTAAEHEIEERVTEGVKKFEARDSKSRLAGRTAARARLVRQFKLTFPNPADPDESPLTSYTDPETTVTDIVSDLLSLLSDVKEVSPVDIWQSMPTPAPLQGSQSDSLAAHLEPPPPKGSSHPPQSAVLGQKRRASEPLPARPPYIEITKALWLGDMDPEQCEHFLEGPIRNPISQMQPSAPPPATMSVSPQTGTKEQASILFQGKVGIEVRMPFETPSQSPPQPTNSVVKKVKTEHVDSFGGQTVRESAQEGCPRTEGGRQKSLRWLLERRQGDGKSLFLPSFSQMVLTDAAVSEERSATLPIHKNESIVCIKKESRTQ